MNDADLTPRQIRKLCRTGELDRPTPGLARGYAQANLVIVREGVAHDFERFCALNPKPCPLLEMTKPGGYEPVKTAPGADLRTDLPRYRVYRGGTPAERVTEVIAHWSEAERDGKGRFVAFLIGCSFTFEAALLDAGVPVRHVEQGCNVSMYRTDIQCTPAGPFHGSLVVSMRPLAPEHIERATRISEQMPAAHGAPVHVGEPAALGINDLAKPDYGDAVTIKPGEIPVFWACGVTPAEAILRAKLDVAITHEPGHMFVTDLRDV